MAGVVLIASAFALKAMRSDPALAGSVVIPDDSWFQPSITNLYRAHPTVTEIVRKYESVDGSVNADAIQSAIMTAKVSLAIGDCVTGECRSALGRLDETRKTLLAAANKLPPGYPKPPEIRPGSLLPKQPAPEELKVSDSVARGYVELGEMTIRSKRPDRVSAEVLMLDLENHGGHVLTTEGYDGSRAWKRESSLDANGNLIRVTDSGLDEKGAEDLKRRSIQGWNRMFDGPSVKYEGLAKVDRRVCYVLSEAVGAMAEREKFYFDAVSGNLIKSDVEGFSIYFDDYKMMAGVLVPGTVYFRRIELGGFHSWTRLKIDRWDFNVPIDDTLFTPAPQ